MEEQLSGIDNPWRTSLENCATGDNELSTQEYHDLIAELDSLYGEVARLKKALAFYANPEIYKPSPHGPAFDRRDLSATAIAALKDGE